MEMNPIYRNILMVRTDRIGDVVLTTPAVHALKKAFPQSRISLLVAPLTQDLVCGNPNIDEVLLDDRKNEHKGLFGFIRLVQLIKSKKFDLAINFHTKKRTNLLCFLARIPHRLGYKNEKLGFLLNMKVFDDRPQGNKHEARYCLDVLKALDIYEEECKVFVPLQDEAEKWAEEFFHENRLDRAQLIIAVHPGASCPTKRWPLERFSELINILNDKYACDIVLIGGKDNLKNAEEIIENLDVPVIDLTGQTSVGQLASLFKRCHLLVSNDSGPVHIADGVGIPVVSIFTRNQPGINPERWKPLGENSQCVAPAPFKSISFKKGEVEDPEYLNKIEVKDVLEAVDAVFKLC